MRAPADRRRPPLALPLLLLVLTATATTAATIEVQVRDENGAPFADVALRLEMPEPVWLSLPRESRPKLHGRTGADGRVEFGGLPPGQYTVAVRRGPTDQFVRPRDNPLAPPPAATLEAETDHVRLDVELWRGTVVVLRVAVDRGQLPRGIAIRMRQRDYGHELTLRMLEREEREQRLIDGRWELILDAPPGYLLRDVEIDGRPVEGHRAELELESLMPTRFVTWYLVAPDTVLAGQVVFEGPKVGVTIVARLIEPGPWIEWVQQRGGSKFQAIEAPVGQLNRYFLKLPSGRWEVQPVGRGIVEADPAVVEIDMPPSGNQRQDFELTTEKDGDESGMISVTVLDPDGELVDDAVVELWPADADGGDGAEPLMRKRTGWSSTYFFGVAKGSYRAVAGHEDFVESSVEIPQFEPEDEMPRVRVTLRRGAVLHATAVDADGRPVEGVALELTFEAEEPEHAIADGELVGAIHAPAARTDATGHAFIRGIYPGDWILRGELRGAGTLPRFVKFDVGGELKDEVRLNLARGEERDIDVRVLPGANLTGALICRAGQPLPAVTTAMALPAVLDLGSVPEGELAAEAVLVQRDLSLTGRLRDTFTAGPLKEGTYYFAVQPAGHDRWTWALGIEDPAEAAPIQAAPGEPVELGALEIDCGPAIRLAPQIASGAELPDLRVVHPKKRTFRIEGTVTGADGKPLPLENVLVDAYRDRLIVRGLPEGDARLRIELHHPFFLPHPEATVTVEKKLERGRTVRLSPVVPDVGGALRIRHPDRTAARLRGPVPQPRLSSFVEGQVDFANLPAGSYVVELCADIQCNAVMTTWTAVEIHPLRTTELP